MHLVRVCYVSIPIIGFSYLHSIVDCVNKTTLVEMLCILNFKWLKEICDKFRLQSAVLTSCQFKLPILTRPPNMQQIPLLPYMVVVECGDCDKHLYQSQLCC